MPALPIGTGVCLDFHREGFASSRSRERALWSNSCSRTKQKGPGYQSGAIASLGIH